MCCAPSFCLSWLEGRFLGNATRRFSCTSLGNEIKTTEKCSDIPAQPLLFKAQHFPRMAPSDVWRYFFVYTPLSVWNTSGNWRLLRQTILLPLEFRRLSLFATGLSPARTKNESAEGAATRFGSKTRLWNQQLQSSRPGKDGCWVAVFLTGLWGDYKKKKRLSAEHFICIHIAFPPVPPVWQLREICGARRSIRLVLISMWEIISITH